MHRLDHNDPYHILFIEETREHLERMEQELLCLESGQAGDDAINTIFRMAHSLKGASATLDIHEMAELSHQLESLLMKVRSGDMELEGSVMEIILEGLDHLRAIHASLIEPGGAIVDIGEIGSRIATLLGQASAGSSETSPDLQEKLPDHRKLFLEGLSPRVRVITVTFEKNLELKCVKAYMAVHALSEIGTVIKVCPEAYEELSDEEFGDYLVIALDSQDSEELVCRRLDAITGFEQIVITQPHAPEHSSSAAGAEATLAAAQPKAGKKRPASGPEEKTSVRVSVHKINKLINLVGELIIDKEAINRLSSDLKRKYPKDPAVSRLLDVYQHMDYLGSELQEIILSTRMLPLDTIFNKFPRMVRDLAVKCNKNVNFTVDGSETGIDRGIIEELVDPLTHLLRNAVDHGIGTPEVRRSKGKPVVGTVSLSASQGENHVLITVGDDGCGIDPECIRQKAVEKGLLSPEVAEQTSREDLIQMVFAPGFSTARDLSVVSGRGVGLDVVKSNISRLNGIIDIVTELDMGTKFTIKLPLTLAIIKAMLVREGCCTFAVPVASIVEVIRLKGSAGLALIHSTAKTEVFSWRDQILPLIWLGSYFELTASRRTDCLYIIIVGHGEKKTAVVVEKILGEQEIVIKSMGDFVGEGKLFGALRGISGVSILGDGSFAQIIDVAAISRNGNPADIKAQV